MSALPKPPLLELPDLMEARLLPMQSEQLDDVVRVENSAYAWPWSTQNIRDSIQSGYQCVQLMAGERELLGYYIAMQGAGEVHLLNLTVAPAYQRQGWARVMLDALALWSRGEGAQWLWLEARVGNSRALSVYDQYGFRRMGVRKDYYPNGNAPRENAVVMGLPL